MGMAISLNQEGEEAHVEDRIGDQPVGFLSF